MKYKLNFQWNTFIKFFYLPSYKIARTCLKDKYGVITQEIDQAPVMANRNTKLQKINNNARISLFWLVKNVYVIKFNALLEVINAIKCVIEY